MEAKHTPGPLFVSQPEKFPFPVQIVNEAGEVVFSEPRHSYSTKHKTVQDVMEARDMRYPKCEPDFVDNCIAANERQLADAYLRAAAPEMLATLKGLLESIDLILGAESPLNQIQKEVIRGFFWLEPSKARAVIDKAEGK